MKKGMIHSNIITMANKLESRLQNHCESNCNKYTASCESNCEFKKGYDLAINHLREEEENYYHG